jgi:hypothetical protein
LFFFERPATTNNTQRIPKHSEVTPELKIRETTNNEMQLQSKYRSKIYRDFRAIEASDWRVIVRYYENCEKQIRELDFEEYFEIMNTYTKALFEIGAYQKHLLMADAVIEASVMNNIKFLNGEDVFHRTLFKKAASCYHLHELEKCEHILRELIRIDPNDTNSGLFLKKCLRKMQSALVRQTRAAAVFLFLMSAIIICFEILLVRSFYPEYDDLVEASRNSIFLLGLVVLAGGDVFHRWRANREVDKFVAMLRRRKKGTVRNHSENVVLP